MFILLSVVLYKVSIVSRGWLWTPPSINAYSNKGTSCEFSSHLSFLPWPGLVCNISFCFRLLMILCVRAICCLFVMSFLTVCEVTLISRRLLRFGRKLSRHFCTLCLLPTPSSDFDTKFTLVTLSNKATAVSRSRLLSIYFIGSWKSFPIAFSILLLMFFVSSIDALTKERSDEKSQLVFSAINAVPLIWNDI